MKKCYSIGIDINGNIDKWINDTYCSCHDSDLKELIIYDGTNKLEILFCDNNVLESLKIRGGKNIKQIDISNNKLKELDLSMCNNLQYIWCDIELDGNIKLPHDNIIIYYE